MTAMLRGTREGKLRAPHLQTQEWNIEQTGVKICIEASPLRHISFRKAMLLKP